MFTSLKREETLSCWRIGQADSYVVTDIRYTKQNLPVHCQRPRKRYLVTVRVKCIGKRGIAALLGVIHATLTRWWLID